MLELTRLNGNQFFVNCDLIQYVEAAPDTILTLVTGEKLVVSESCGHVVHAVLGCRAEVLRRAWPDAESALAACAAHDAATHDRSTPQGSMTCNSEAWKGL